MRSNELDPKLESATTKLARNLDDQLRRLFLPAARRYLEKLEVSEDEKSSLLARHGKEELRLLLPELDAWHPSSVTDRFKLETVGFFLREQEHFDSEKLRALDLLLRKFHVLVLQKARQHLAKYARDDGTCRSVARALVESLLPEPTEESKAARRAIEIVRLGKVHGIDQERVVSWIADGRTDDAVSREILDGVAKRAPRLYSTGTLEARHAPELVGREDPASTSDASPTTIGQASEEQSSGPGRHARELADVVRRGMTDGVDADRIAERIEVYWRAELTSADVLYGDLKPRASEGTPMRELFELFGVRERVWTWRAEFEPWLVGELQQGDDGDLAASSGRRTTDEGVVTRTQAQTGASTAFPSPPETRAPVESGQERALHRGKECEERAQEIAKIRRMVQADGMTIHRVRHDHPEFGIWEVVKALPKEWQDTFDRPTEWGPAKGFANNLLAKFYDKAPSTIDGWRKDWRSHERNRKPN